VCRGAAGAKGEGFPRAAAEGMTDQRIIAYLLEELPPEEAERFEEECFAAEDWPGELAAVEGELIEDYLRGELTPERRRRFETQYLTTAARRERVRMVAALLRHSDEAAKVTLAPAPPPPPRRTLLESLRASWGLRTAVVSLALVACVAAVGWWATRERGPGGVYELTLNVSSSERAAGARPTGVRLPREAGELRITLLLPEGHPPAARYRAELEDERGRVTAPAVTPNDSRAVTATLPASALSRGSHALKLYAVAADGVEHRVPGSYFFIIE